MAEPGDEIARGEQRAWATAGALLATGTAVPWALTIYWLLATFVGPDMNAGVFAYLAFSITGTACLVLAAIALWRFLLRGSPSARAGLLLASIGGWLLAAMCVVPTGWDSATAAAPPPAAGLWADVHWMAVLLLAHLTLAPTLTAICSSWALYRLRRRPLRP